MRKKFIFFKLIPNDVSKSTRFTFSTRLRSSQSCITPVSLFVNRNINNQNAQTPSIASDDRSSGVESLIPSPIQSPVVSILSIFPKSKINQTNLSYGVQKKFSVEVYVHLPLIIIE